MSSVVAAFLPDRMPADCIRSPGIPTPRVTEGIPWDDPLRIAGTLPLEEPAAMVAVTLAQAKALAEVADRPGESL